MMEPVEDRNREKRFVEAWKAWVQRPPRQTPAEAAARVVDRLSKGSRGQPWWFLAAAAVVLSVALAVHWTTVVNRSPETGAGAAAPEYSPIGKGEVLIWLDDQTPLYMTFQPPEKEAAQQEKS